MTGSRRASRAVEGVGWRTGIIVGVAASSLFLPGVAGAQEPSGEAEWISVEWNAAPMGDVLRAFEEFSGKAFVAASDVTGTVTAFIEDEHGIVHAGAAGAAGTVNAGAEPDAIVTRA